MIESKYQKYSMLKLQNDEAIIKSNHLKNMIGNSLSIMLLSLARHPNKLFFPRESFSKLAKTGTSWAQVGLAIHNQ